MLCDLDIAVIIRDPEQLYAYLKVVGFHCRTLLLGRRSLGVHIITHYGVSRAVVNASDLQAILVFSINSADHHQEHISSKWPTPSMQIFSHIYQVSCLSKLLPWIKRAVGHAVNSP